MRIVAFVEGSDESALRGGVKPYLAQLWQDLFVERLGLRKIERVVAISKKHLVALDPKMPKMSGAGEALDELMARCLRQSEFDAAIVAWDLLPQWNPDATCCRWIETKSIYKFIAERRKLPDCWIEQASARYAELDGRTLPSLRRSPPVVEKGAILPLCMETMFESFIVSFPKVIRKALGAESKKAVSFPNLGADARRAADELQAALRAANRLEPRPGIVRKIRGDMRTAKNAWNYYFVGSILDEHGAADHPLLNRLRELLVLDE